MKKTIFLTVVVITIFGCKKDLQTTHINTQIAGGSLFDKWELRRTSGGLQPDVNYAAGNGNIVQFKADSTYAFYVGGDAVSKHGTFHITKNTLTMGAITFDMIYYDGAGFGEPITLHNDSLTIGTSAADGPSALYIRQ